MSAVSIERAIELNGAAVELGIRKAFRIGRLLRHDPARFADTPRHETTATVEADLDALIRNRESFLTEYQDAAYAARYRQLVDRVRAAEHAACGSEASTASVARNYFKLLAYKDEYEVARLYTPPPRFVRTWRVSSKETSASRSCLHRRFCRGGTAAQASRARLLLAPGCCTS